MVNSCTSCSSGLTVALLKLDEATTNVVKATTPQTQSAARDGAPVTGATGAPSGGSGDAAWAFLDLMSAEMSFRANVEVVRTQTDMVRALYDAID